MTLHELQQRVAAALMLPLTPRDRLAPRTKDGAPMADEAAKLIKPNPRLTSRERLEIYSRSYWFRLLDSLREDFPGLATILGPVAFERLARAYVAGCPSESFTLRDLGSRLAAWLEHHPGYAQGNLRLALDMVQLEWAHIVAFDGPTASPLTHEDLASFTPALRIGLQPYISLLRLQYPVDRIRLQSSRDRGISKTASNGVQKRIRASARQISTPEPEPILLAVHRFDLSVYYRRLSAGEFSLLEGIHSGQPIGRAIERSLVDGTVAASDAEKRVSIWFRTWARLGWLTARRKSRRGHS